MKKLWYSIADFIRESDKLMMILVFVTSMFGCVMVFSATRYTGSHRQFFTQLFAVLLGTVLAIIISGVDYKTIVRFWPVAAVVGIIPVLLTFFIGVGVEGTDDRAWLILPGGLSFQPAELLKIVFIITFAAHINACKDNINDFKNLFLLALHGAAPVLIVHEQGDDGTAIIFALIMICMLYAAGVKKRYFVIGFILLLIAIPVIYFLVMNDDQRARVVSLFNPESDIKGIGWQQYRARIALSNGGVFGRGLTKGPLTQIKGGVPKGYNDFIFISVGEELGFVGCLVVFLLLCSICIRSLVVGKLAHDTTGRMICTGFFAMIAFQSVINIAMALSLLPVIGVTLPFFSAGGTSLLCLYLGVGLVWNVYRHRNPRTMHLHDDF